MPNFESHCCHLNFTPVSSKESLDVQPNIECRCWWWLAHPTLLRHHMHLVYFLFKAANFQIRHLLTFWWRFLRHSGPVRLSAYIRPMITWYLFFNLIGHWSCDMWPHLAQWWCPHFSWTSVACGFPLNQTIDQRLFYRQIFLWEFDGLRTCTLSCLCGVQSCVWWRSTVGCANHHLVVWTGLLWLRLRLKLKRKHNFIFDVSFIIFFWVYRLTSTSENNC